MEICFYIRSYSQHTFESVFLKYTKHCVKSVLIRSHSGLDFPAFGLNTKRYGISLRIQFECWKIRTRITPNMDNYCAVEVSFNSSDSANLQQPTTALVIEKNLKG